MSYKLYKLTSGYAMALFRNKGYRSLPESTNQSEVQNFSRKSGRDIYWFLPAMSRHSYKLTTKQNDELVQLFWESYCHKHFDHRDPRFRDYIKATPDNIAWVFDSHRKHLQAKKHSALISLTSSIDQSTYTKSIKYAIIDHDDLIIHEMSKQQREFLDSELDEYKQAETMLGRYPYKLPSVAKFLDYANSQVKQRTDITSSGGFHSVTLTGFKDYTDRLAKKKNNQISPKPQ